MLWQTGTLPPASVIVNSSTLQETDGITVEQQAESMQLVVYHVTAVAIGTLSLVSTTAAVACFMKMPRRFRHEYVDAVPFFSMPNHSRFVILTQGLDSLILLLILGDMLKTLWLVILPLVELVHGEIQSSSCLCQISGFFLAVGIEACDLAVMLMAAHTGMYVLRGRSGLYPYRKSAFAVVAIGSLMLASLAFVDKPAFVNSGPYCYVTAQSAWTIQALSWIPRYVVVAVVVLTYTSIYVYVRCVVGIVHDPGTLRTGSGSIRDDDCSLPQMQGSVPSIPTISKHGSHDFMPAMLLPSDSSSGGCEQDVYVDEGLCQRQGIIPSSPCATTEEKRDDAYTEPARPRAVDRRARPQDLVWNIPNYACDDSQNKESADIADQHTQPTTSKSPPCSPRQTPCRPVARPENSSRQGESIPVPLASLVMSSLTIQPASAKPKLRVSIRRQLRQLFVYPLVYMAGWLIPFVLHVKGGDKTGKPFWLVLASLVSMCFQGFADSALFLTLEKPWQSWRRDVSLWRLFPCGNSAARGTKSRVGRSREEMLIDGTTARMRREQEDAEEHMEQEQANHVSRQRDWWDAPLADIDASGGGDLAEARLRA